MNDEIYLFDDQKTELLFSSVFAVLIAFLLQKFPILQISQNIIYLPFNLIHQIGHFFGVSILLPMIDPVFEINPIKDCICSNTIRIEELQPNWSSVYMLIAGTVFMIFVTTLILLIFRKNTSIAWGIIQRFLLFGFLFNLTNLFPILPSMLGSTNDGYAVTVILLRMGFSTYPSVYISMLFAYLAVIFVLISYFCLGSCIYHVITIPTSKLQRQSQNLMKSYRM